MSLAMTLACSVGLAKFDPQAPNESIENVEAATIEQFDLEEHGIGQWIHYVNVIAAVSPMIGLLGTVSGMIGGIPNHACRGEWDARSFSQGILAKH